MILAPVCQTSNVFANEAAVSLMQEFCSCPAALKTLTEITIPLTVKVAKFAAPAITNVRMDENYKLQKSTIKISTKFTQNRISALCFEVFNVIQNDRLTNLFRIAENGDIGMDEFSKSIELSEINGENRSYSLKKECSPFWKIEEDEAEELNHSFTVEEQLWQQDLEGHTDRIRLRWIKKFQKPYCDKHPKDERSCSINKNQLYDLYSKKLTDSQLQNRICEKLPLASERLKELYKPMVEATCPEIFKQKISVENFVWLVIVTTASIALSSLRCLKFR